MGRHCVDALLKRRDEWRVVTLSRRDLQGLSKDDTTRVQQVKADLMDRGLVESALRDAGVSGVTAIFLCAYLMKAEPAEECEVNLAMLRGMVEAAEAVGPASALRHECCMEGGKWYGQQLSTLLNPPHREDDPPIMPPMFYYDLQGSLEGRVKGGAGRTWSALRPGLSFMNLTTSIAIYASVCEELGLPHRFPGGQGAWEGLIDVCNADLLAEGMLHCATTPACANQAFSISNGDCFRWKDMWPALPACFDLPVAPPLTMSLVKDTPYDQLATWQFADFVFNFPGSWFCKVNKLWRTGFDKMHIDSDGMFAALFQRMRKQKVIP